MDVLRISDINMDGDDEPDDALLLEDDAETEELENLDLSVPEGVTAGELGCHLTLAGGDLTMMVFDHLCNDGQTESGSFSCFLCSKERFEDFG